MDSNFGQMNEELCVWKKGFVVFLDVLGTKNLGSGKEKTEDFLNKYFQILKGLPILKKQANALKNMNVVPFRTLDIALLNDTLIICMEPSFDYNICKEDIEIYNSKIFHINLFTLGGYLQQIFHRSLQLSVPLSGVINYGDYVCADKSIDQSITKSIIILGPAVYKAAVCYEQSNWLGINVTPSLNAKINKCLRILESYNFEGVLQEYAVPLKDQTSLNLWCVNWPIQYLRSLKQQAENNIEFEDVERNFRADIAKIKRPSNVEPKYHHAAEFFEYIKKHDPRFTID